MSRKLDRREFLIIGGWAAGGAITWPVAPAHASNGLRVGPLKVDYVANPIGLENLRPMFSWQLLSPRRNTIQRAYRINVSTRPEKLESGSIDVWDSGEVQSADSFGVAYGGAALTSRRRYWWRVQVWDEQGASSFSPSSSWEMGILDPSQWSGQWLMAEDPAYVADYDVQLQWIQGAQADPAGVRAFRAVFQLPRRAVSARFFADTDAASTISRIWVDGELTASTKQPLEQRWIETGPLDRGKHLIAIELAIDEVAASYRMKPTFELLFFACANLDDGSRVRFATGRHWKTCVAPPEGWHLASYADEEWREARLVAVDLRPWPTTPAVHLRHPFAVTKPVLAARLYATALGCYEARLNGQRVGNALLTPELTQYATRLHYRVVDVTPLLKPGDNVLGLTVGDGWYASFDGRYAWGQPPRRAYAQLELTFADGSRQTVVSGRGWRIANSPILASQIRQGEVFDGRLTHPGWDSVAFDDTRWPNAVIVDAPPARLVAQVSPPIRETATLKPRSVYATEHGVVILDFGQNFAGWCRIRVVGEKGTEIELRFGELLTPAGELDQSSMGIKTSFVGRLEPKADHFILAGAERAETFEPHFVYRGFRYVQITGLPSLENLQDAEGVVIRNDLPVTGQFHSESSFLNDLWQTIFRTQCSNVVSIFTDNPTREKRGWLCDAGVFWDTASFNMDVCAFTSRMMDNVRDTQAPEGAIAQIAPLPEKELESSPGWGDAAIILPWTVWRRYGDLAIIERNWEMMDRYLSFIANANPDFVWRNKRGGDWGDWLAVDEVPQFIDPTAVPSTNKELIATAYWAWSASLLAQMADAIGRNSDAARLRHTSARVRANFVDLFVKDNGMVGTGSQTSQVLALKFGLVPAGLRRAASARLAADVCSRGKALTTGFLGTQFILDVLVDAGFSELAYDLLLRTEYPSWGHMMRSSTTILESWKPFDKPVVGEARNQPALGSIGGFLYRRVAGIDEQAPGFKSILIRPLPDARIKRAGASYESVVGRISTDWELSKQGGFRLNVCIPPNAKATVHLPTPVSDRAVLEGGRDVQRRSDVRVLGGFDKEMVLEVGSGAYEFMVVN